MFVFLSCEGRWIAPRYAGQSCLVFIEIPDMYGRIYEIYNHWAGARDWGGRGHSEDSGGRREPNIFRFCLSVLFPMAQPPLQLAGYNEVLPAQSPKGTRTGVSGADRNEARRSAEARVGKILAYEPWACFGSDPRVPCFSLSLPSSRFAPRCRSIQFSSPGTVPSSLGSSTAAGATGARTPGRRRTASRGRWSRL